MFFEISQTSQENTCVRASFLIKLQVSACNVTKNETLAKVFSCEFCKLYKNTFFTKHVRTTASKIIMYYVLLLQKITIDYYLFFIFVQILFHFFKMLRFRIFLLFFSYFRLTFKWFWNLLPSLIFPRPLKSKTNAEIFLVC